MTTAGGRLPVPQCFVRLSSVLSPEFGGLDKTEDLRDLLPSKRKYTLDGTGVLL